MAVLSLVLGIVIFYATLIVLLNLLVDLLYGAIDGSDFYASPVRPDCRSWMNVPFTLADPELDGRFLEEAKAAGLTNLKGHRSVGGMRASIYNAVSEEAVDALIACEENGIIPDYYMKTMHYDNYWSAHPIENRVPFEVDGKNYLDHNKFHNNCFCLFQDRTLEFVNWATVPVMRYKLLEA